MAEAELHQSGWPCIIDFTIYGTSTVCNTLLTILWIRYAYFSKSGSNNTNKTNYKSKSGLNDTNPTQNQIDSSMISITRHDIPFLGRLYITISIIFAMLFSCFMFLYFILWELKIITEDVILDTCVLIVLCTIPYAFNRLFLYLYFIWRIQVSFTDSVLEVSERKLKILSISSSILFIIFVLWNILYIEMVGCAQNATYHILLGGAPFILLDSALEWLCLYLFVSRLRKIIKHDSIHGDVISLQYIANKFTILSVFTIRWTIFTSLLFLFTSLSSMAGIDTLLNVICLILSTKNYDLYYQIKNIVYYVGNAVKRNMRKVASKDYLYKTLVVFK